MWIKIKQLQRRPGEQRGMEDGEWSADGRMGHGSREEERGDNCRTERQ